jgi:bZIP-type transcription factor MBZ1
LLEENTRLSDLTRMLLSSPSFSGFLDTLASNPQAAQTAQAVQQPQQQIEQPQRQIRKDVNPYAAQQQMQQQQIGMAMIPEHNMDFSMLDLNENGAFSYQPQVFSVLSLPEAVIDTDILSGKGSSFTPLASDDEKVELPKVERMPISEPSKVELPIVVDEEFDADPVFALFVSSPAAPAVTKSEPELDLSFLANLSLKPANFELVVVPEVDEATADAAMRRVERISADMDACLERLSRLSCHL